MFEINLVKNLGVRGGDLADVLEEHYDELREIDSCRNQILRRLKLAMFSTYPCRVIQRYRFLPIFLREREKTGGFGLDVDQILKDACNNASGLSEVTRNKFTSLVDDVKNMNSRLVARYMYRRMRAFYRNR